MRIVTGQCRASPRRRPALASAGRSPRYSPPVTAEPLPRAHPSSGPRAPSPGTRRGRRSCSPRRCRCSSSTRRTSRASRSALASTTIDVTLADLAVACVVAAAVVRGRREGCAPLRRARWLLSLAAAFVALRCAVARDALAPRRGLRARAARGERAKFAVVRALAPRRGPAARARRRGTRCRCSGRSSPGASPRPPWGLLQFLGLVSRVRGQAAGAARAVVRRDPRLRGAVGRGARRRRRRRRARRRRGRSGRRWSRRRARRRARSASSSRAR